MRDDLVDAVVVPQFAGIKPNARGYPRAVVPCALAGAVVRGTVTAVAWALDGAPGTVAATTGRDALAALLAPVAGAMRRRRKPLVVVGAHDLGLLLGAALYPHLRPWSLAVAKHGKIPVGDGTLEYWGGRIWFARYRIGRASALLIDTARFFAQDLTGGAAILGAPAGPDAPDGYGSRRLGVRAVRSVLAWEAETTAALLAAILRWHQDRDLYPSVSVAQLAMRYFRHRYVRARWQTTPKQVQTASLLAYHAGRNGLYVAPGWRRVTILDMNAAYAWAMLQLPSFNRGRWGRVNYDAGPWGFYRLTGGTIYQGKYPLLFAHDFSPLPSGPIGEPVWITGVELEAAKESGVLTGATCWGYAWRPESRDRPLRRYIMECWRRRQRARTPEAQLLWKLLAVSLYGKFIAKIEADGDEAADRTGDQTLRRYGPNGVLLAGGQFYPVAAAWITALVRVKLWRKEWAEGSWHSATDGIMVDPGKSYPSSGLLGGWKVEGENVWTLILKNKFYLVFDAAGRLLKAATHGFYGTPADVITMLKSGRNTYLVERSRGWLEAGLTGKRPYVSDPAEFTVTCGVSGFWPPPITLEIPLGRGRYRVES